MGPDSDCLTCTHSLSASFYNCRLGEWMDEPRWIKAVLVSFILFLFWIKCVTVSVNGVRWLRRGWWIEIKKLPYKIQFQSVDSSSAVLLKIQSRSSLIKVSRAKNKPLCHGWSRSVSQCRTWWYLTEWMCTRMIVLHNKITRSRLLSLIISSSFSAVTQFVDK